MTYLAQPRATKESQDTGHHLAEHEQSFLWKILTVFAADPGAGRP
jgi:hypothetical protein